LPPFVKRPDRSSEQLSIRTVCALWKTIRVVTALFPALTKHLPIPLRVSHHSCTSRVKVEMCYLLLPVVTHDYTIIYSGLLVFNNFLFWDFNDGWKTCLRFLLSSRLLLTRDLF